MSYNAKIYQPQGADQLIVADGGTIVIQDGGILEVESGGEISIASGGKITAAGTQANHIADITNEATGTQIATAVNAILAALEGVGILKTS